MRHKKDSNSKGYALVLTLAFSAIFIIMVAGVMSLVNAEINMGRYHADSAKAFFLAEAGIERVIATIRDGGTPSASLDFTLSQTGLSDDATLDAVVITITSSTIAPNTYQLTSTAALGSSTRVVKANIMYNPPSKVFDYAYFINNWGWLYGDTITINGDIRSNGRCDNGGYNPVVEGEIYAAQGIGGQENYRGKAGTVVDEEYIYQHPNSPVVSMPNLQDLSYYETAAVSAESTISIGDTVIVSAVFGDDAGECGNIVLVGTTTNPVHVDGPVVVRGDVVITGTITGQGTVYSGRNVYVAGGITYSNPPDSPRPSSDDQGVIDQWVADNENKDIVGFAASENVVLGDYTGTTGGPWYADNWLFSMGSEDVGEDGIPDTSDTGEGDGVFQSAYEDLDGDGIFDNNYTWTDIQTQVDITSFYNVPGGVTGFGDLATNYISSVDGIYYTNHAFAGRVGYDVVVNGSIISKDEAIIYRNYITMNYDERTNSKYKSDPNWLIDLQLPFSERVRVIGWWEG